MAGCVVSAIYGNDFFLGDDADALGFDFGSGMSGNGTTPSASSIQRIGDSLISSSVGRRSSLEKLYSDYSL